MRNSFIKATIYMISMSFSCILSDVFSKIINVNLWTLLFWRFFLSNIFLIIYYIYVNYKKTDRKTFLQLLILFFLIHLTIYNSFYWFIKRKMFLFLSIFIIVLLSLFIMTKKLLLILKKFFNLNNLIRGFLFGIGMIFFMYGLMKLSLGLLTLLNFFTPIFTVLLSKIYLKEDLKNRLFLCLINTVGIFFAVFPYIINNSNLYAIISVISSSICFAFIDVFNKDCLNSKNKLLPIQKITEDESLLEILIGSSFFSTIFFLFVLIIKTPRVIRFSIYEFGVTILIGFLAILIPFFILKASELTDLSALQPLKYIEFPLSIIFGYLFFNDTYTYHIFIGFIIILFSYLLNYCEEICIKQ